MPQSKKAIQVPVNVKLEIANQHKVLSNLAGDMQETMSGFDPASALYKNAVKSFSKIASKLNFSEALLGKDFFSEADLSRVVKEMGMVSDIMTEINFKIQNTKSFKTLGIDTTELDNARESLAALRKEISKQSNKSVGSLMGTGKGQVSSSFLGELQGLSSKSGFKADKSYAANITTMTSKLEQQKATYQSLQNEIDKATQEAEEYLNVTGRLANDISGVKLKGTNADIAAAMSKMIRSHTVGEDGNWVAGGKAYAQATSRWLGLGQIDFSKSAQEIADAIEQAINAALSEKGGRTGNALVQNSRKYSTGTDAEKQAIEDLVQEDSSLALKQVEELKKNATAHNQLTSSIEAQITTLKQLREAYEGEIARLNKEPLDKAQQRVNNAIVAANKQLEEQHNNAKDANKTAGGAQENVYKAYDANAEQQRQANLQKEAADRRAQEAQQFSENLKQSIRHWMSAQQIINIVKDGIRQAVQDIKGLDSAMSNIAVVTDMSISDLWGKINDYMAIAQQYGVTTQGVYEVSQLYYQQGLATAEVMELTTETLKLARVANMDYKDSADAMTVALRGFKMEMSEAATVTDVYSKVAAVTASDQAELAIAMSKTASSAASVGSSFENTTAMLAVMVETTRESAQNLGSALKSIISRYGEMKSGLTQDSEGEIIDYNKVDTALRSIGISIKDAQGQFRDFDDVIFELSEAWGGLDKNTQRYIATIMAGNRQQSRFIALVDNYERLKEVQAAADNSEDAGLLQYAKTLDSLETKMNNIKTGFQQFYMSIFNGEDFKGILDVITNVITSLNRMGPALGALNVLNLINQIKMIGQLLVKSFSSGLSRIASARKEMQERFSQGWESVGNKIADLITKGIKTKVTQSITEVKKSAIQTINPNQPSQSLAAQALSISANMEKDNKFFVQGGVLEEYKSWAAKLDRSKASPAELKLAQAIDNAAQRFGQGTEEAALAFIRGVEEAVQIELTGAKDEVNLELNGAKRENLEEQKNAKKNGFFGTIKNWANSDKGFKAGQAAYAIGTVASMAGMAINQETMSGYDASTGLQFAGGAASAIGQALTGDLVGAAITGVTTLFTTVKRISEREKVELENLEKAAEEKNIERAEKNNRAQELSETLSNLKKLQAARNESQEAEQAFIEASNAAAEKFPELVSYYDDAGNAIIESTEGAMDAEYLLIDARLQAAKAATEAAAAELEAAEKNKANAQKEADEYRKTLVAWNEYTENFGIASLMAEDMQPYLMPTNSEEPYAVNEWLKLNSEATDVEYIKYLQSLVQEIEDQDLKKEAELALLNSLNSSIISGETFESLNDYFAAANLAFSTEKTADVRANAGRRAWETSQTTSFLTQMDPLEEAGWRELEKGYSTFLKIAEASFNWDEGFIDENGKATSDAEDHMRELLDGEDGLYNRFNEWIARGLSEQQEELFNDFMSNPANYSLAKAEDAIERLKLDSSEGLGADFMALWASETLSEYERLIAAFGIENISSREENQTDAQYIGTIIEDLQNSKDPIQKLLSYDLQTAQQYLEFQQECQDIIDAGGAGKTAAKNRQKAVLDILNTITDKGSDGFIFGLEETQFNTDSLAELKTLLTASNAGTYEWGYEIAELIERVTGKDVFSSIENMLYENINTRIEAIMSSADETIDGIADLASKQEKGFTFTDARSFASKLNKEFSEVFETTEDGKLVLKDYKTSLTDYYNYELRNLQDLSKTLDEAYSEIGSRNLVDTRQIYSLPIIQGSKELQAELDKFFEEYPNATKKEVLEFLRNLSAGITEVSSVVQMQAQQTVSQAAFDDFIQSQAKDLTISYESFWEIFGTGMEEDFDGFFEEFENIVDFDTGKIKDFGKLKQKLGDKWDQYGDSVTQAYLGQFENTLSGTNDLLAFIAEQGLDLNTLKSKHNIDIISFSDTMSKLPTAYAEYIADLEMDASQKAQLLSNYRQGLFDSTTNLLQGSGSWEEATRLQAMVGPEVGLEFRETADGIQLMNESLGALLLRLQEDNSPLYAQTYSEITKNIQEYYPELKDVYDIQKKIAELEEDKTAENEEQLKLLKAAANYASNIAGYAGFDFMSSSLAGNAENYLTYIENIGNAQNILKEFGSSGKIGAGDFMRMMQFAEDSGQKIPGWDKIYAAVNTADSDGNISKQALIDVFGDNPLQAIAQLMKDADFEFRQDQYSIQEDRTKTAQILSGGKDSIESQWTEITDGKAPLTVRIDGDAATAADADEIAKAWAALADVERDEILTNGIWEISTDTTGTIKEAANALDEMNSTLTGIEEDVNALANPEHQEPPVIEQSSEEDWLKNNNKELMKENNLLRNQIAVLDNTISSLEEQNALLQERNDLLQNSDSNVNKLANEDNKGSNKFAGHVEPLIKAKEAAIQDGEEYAETLQYKIDDYGITFSPEMTTEEITKVLNDWKKQNGVMAIRVILYQDGTVRVQKIGAGGSGGSGVDPAHYISNVYGNVNGLALANGNATSKLIAGASMANKTLVGELGPELAVYNGQYHLLGQNGAEFVNLPSDAIVFNHKQTEGIAKGQMGVRGTALAGGNFNWYEALEALWRQGDKSSFDSGWGQFFGNTGGKGGSKTYEFAEQEGEEWYNYLRRIAKLEQEINQLEAERENIMDGGAYLRNLREVQAVYQEQLITQKQLLEYQKAQLELERKQIQEKWGGALTFTGEGLLQYIFGNEVNGGKGILSLFEAFNKMSGAQQVAAVTGIGYSYTDQNGKKLEGEELVQKFLEELTGDIEHYDDLYDSVADATTELEDFKKAIKDIEEEIRDNRIELEEKIYDLVVEGWENNIEKMEEELDILSEANDRYINGLSEALEKEKSLYDKNEATADREQLQRRLSLLRRSGGSASEIASLEEQLNDTLKDEYFQHQQEAIDKVAEASETQIEKMEEQIQIQKDQLEFSKEHGLIWEDVNRILSGSTSEILEFIQGNDSTFIEKSATEIGKQLEEWSKKVGIFTEDRQAQEYTKEAIKSFNADTLNSGIFNKASDEQKKAYTDMFASYFANARMDGKNADEAYAYAYDELRKTLGEDGRGSDTGNSSGGGNTDTETPNKPKQTLYKFTFNGKEIRGYRSKPLAVERIMSEYEKLLKEYNLSGKETADMPGYDRLKKAQAIRDAAVRSISYYSNGGLVDYTGLAMVHGSKSRPESFLNAEQTAQITEALRSNGKNSVLSEVRQAVSEIAAAAKALVMNETNNSSSINVAPGAVVVKVEKLNDKYDIDSVADDIMNKMVSIASKATSRGVNRR